jgi:hypothetical protein
MRTIFAVGTRGSLPTVQGRTIKVLPLDRVKEAARARPGGTILIVGPDALRRLSPDKVLKSLPFPYVAVLLVESPGLEPELRAWRRIGVMTVGPRDSLERAVTGLLGLSPRVMIPAAVWVPSGIDRDPALRHAVTLLPECGRPCIEEWAAQLAVERHWLNRRFQKACGMTATDVCRKFIYEYDRREESRGIPRTHIAAALSFRNPSNLRRGLRAYRALPWLERELDRGRTPDLAGEVPK